MGTEQPGTPPGSGEARRGVTRGKIPRKVWALIIGLSALSLALPASLRLFVVEAFAIPSAGMYPSLLIGDNVLVTKWDYGCEECTPERGQSFVFRYPLPAREPLDYIKRVIALPGDELVVEHGAPVINGWKVPRCSLGRTTLREADGSEHGYELFVEFLVGSAYLVAHEDGRDDGVQGPYRVGPNEAWVLGDNRNNSSDSRAWRGGQGAGVPFASFHGPVRALWAPAHRARRVGAGPPTLPDEAGALAPRLASCLASAPSLAASTPPRP